MPLKTQFDDPPALNLTSMIDVVFQLIVFFMVGTRFASPESKLDIQVPRVADAASAAGPATRQVIHVGREGQLFLNSDRVTPEELGLRLAALRRSSRDLGVMVRGDGTGAFQNVASVLAIVRKAGFSDVGISVKTDAGPHIASGLDSTREAGTRR